MCKQFVTGPLNQTLGASGLLDIMEYNFYPWGNAYYNTSQCGTSSYNKQVGMTCWEKECGYGAQNPPADCFTGTILCQHGDEECQWNRWEACAVATNSNDVLKFSMFANCVESGGYFTTAKKCAEANGLDWDKLNECYNGSAGDEAQKSMAQATANLNPAHLGTPWVIVNGVVLDDPSTLLQSVCAAYDGAKPAGCSGARLIQHSKRISDTKKEKAELC